MVQDGAVRSGTGAQPVLNTMVTREKPPTYHLTDKYTGGFQACG